jgi:hypothetical protein
MLNKGPTPRWAKLIVVILLLTFSFQCVMSLRDKSPTWDETHYLGIGKYLLTHFTWDIKGAILHPPLSYLIHDVPLLFFPTPEIKPLDVQVNKVYLGTADLARGNRILMSEKYDGETLFFLSRLSMIPLSLLLGIFVFLWAKNLYSAYAGVFSLFLYCFSPNIIAHARLITPDLALTCFSFSSIYFYWKFTTEHRYKHLLFSALSLGLALASKYSALLLFPIFMTVFITNTIVGFYASSDSFRAVGKSALNLLFLFFLSIVPILVFYGFDLSPYFDGVVFQFKKGAWGHAAFLDGNISWEGWWYFLIYAFLLKTPMPTLILIIAALGIGNHKKFIFQKKEYFLIMSVMVYVIFFSCNHQSIGLRYILPIYPFLFVYLGRIFEFMVKTRKVVVGLVIGLISWYLVGTLNIYPHYLAYFNECAGGPSNGYRYLVDSNLDWGQDLKLLKRYMDARGIGEISLDYFGSVDPAFYDICYKKIDENTFPLSKGWCAISATKLQGVYSLAGESAYAELKKKKPVAQIGYTTFLYYLD